jgi:hypothetical protein
VERRGLTSSASPGVWRRAGGQPRVPPRQGWRGGTRVCDRRPPASRAGSHSLSGGHIGRWTGGPPRQPPACDRRPARESRPLVLARLGHRPDPPSGARLVARHRLFQQHGCAMPRLSRRGRQDVPPLTHVGRSRRVPRCRRGGVRLCAALECDSSQISARMNERRTRLLLAVRQVSAEAMFGARRWVKSRPLEPPVRPAPSNVRHRKQPPGCVLNRGRP